MYLVTQVTGASSTLSTTSIAADSTIALEAVLELVAHMAKEPAFNQLRTVEQLGYIVHTAVKRVGNSVGMHVIVQSSHKDPVYLDQRVEEFIGSYRSTLAAMEAEEVEKNRQAVSRKYAEIYTGR